MVSPGDVLYTKKMTGLWKTFPFWIEWLDCDGVSLAISLVCHLWLALVGLSCFSVCVTSLCVFTELTDRLTDAAVDRQSEEWKRSTHGF